jgi:hypothetical protein
MTPSKIIILKDIKKIKIDSKNSIRINAKKFKKSVKRITHT